MVGSRLPTDRPTPDDAAVRAAAQTLVDRRFLLPEDLDQAVATAIDGSRNPA